MQLLTKELRRKLPNLGETSEQGMEAMEAKALVKFFTPDGSWTWYATEFDGEDTFFGLVDGLYLEFGTFSLSELQKVRGKLGLPVERDKWLTPTPLAVLMKKHTKL
jgi:Protein of unknown function (DUF2958)